MIEKDLPSRAVSFVGKAARLLEYALIPGTGNLGGDFFFGPKGFVVSVDSSSLVSTESQVSLGFRGNSKPEEKLPDDSTSNGKVINNHLGMTFVYIPPDKFTMVSPESELGWFAFQVSLVSQAG